MGRARRRRFALLKPHTWLEPPYEFRDYLAELLLNYLAELVVGQLRLSDDQALTGRLDYGCEFQNCVASFL